VWETDAKSRDLADPDDPPVLTDSASRHPHADAVWEGDIALADGLGVGVERAAAHMGKDGCEIRLGENSLGHEIPPTYGQ
jgi:hypothetical protein